MLCAVIHIWKYVKNGMQKCGKWEEMAGRWQEELQSITENIPKGNHIKEYVMQNENNWVGEKES